MNDLISRQEVKEILRTEWIKLFPMELDPYLSLAMEKIENIPSEESKKGQWTNKEVFDIPDGVEEWQSAKCSTCGLYHTTPYLYYFDNFNFCPNCGAKMEENNG